MDLRFDIKQAGSSDILAHLRTCDRSFLPVLSTRVELETYAAKLARFAVTFEAWEQGTLVGLIGAYLNDPARMEGYISTVSTVPGHWGRGIADRLLGMLLAYADGHGFETLSLEVAESNAGARKLYEKHGFAVTGKSGTMLNMARRS